MELVTQTGTHIAPPDAASIFAVVKVKESPDSFWKEIADVETYSASGASIHLRRECRVGTLISLKMALPSHLRFHDHDRQLYRIWGLVQHCQRLSGLNNDGYHVGVVFIGGGPPESYAENPARTYRICGMDTSGFWCVEPAAAEFKTRREIRYWTEIELYLALLNNKKEPLAGERTVTENISRGGAAVISKMSISVGDKVKFISAEYDFSGLAVVCDRRERRGGKSSLHLQFVDAKFPVEKLQNNPREKNGERKKRAAPPASSLTRPN